MSRVIRTRVSSYRMIYPHIGYSYEDARHDETKPDICGCEVCHQRRQEDRNPTTRMICEISLTFATS
jgi:hypothetical protein